MGPNLCKPHTSFLQSDHTLTSLKRSLSILTTNPHPITVRFRFRNEVCLSIAPPITRVATLSRCLEERPQGHVCLQRPQGRVPLVATAPRTGLLEPKGQSSLDLVLGNAALCLACVARADSAGIFVGSASHLAGDYCSNPYRKRTVAYMWKYRNSQKIKSTQKVKRLLIISNKTESKFSQASFTSEPRATPTPTQKKKKKKKN